MILATDTTCLDPGSLTKEPPSAEERQRRWSSLMILATDTTYLDPGSLTKGLLASSLSVFVRLFYT